jgi:hypothetical protein
MDLEGLIEVLAASRRHHPLPRRRHAGPVAVRARTPQRQPLRLPRRSGLEERRARAVSLGRVPPDSVFEAAGKLDQPPSTPSARVLARPPRRARAPRPPAILIALPLHFIDTQRAPATGPTFYERLRTAAPFDLNGEPPASPPNASPRSICAGHPCWIATESRCRSQPRISLASDSEKATERQVTKEAPSSNVFKDGYKFSAHHRKRLRNASEPRPVRHLPGLSRHGDARASSCAEPSSTPQPRKTTPSNGANAASSSASIA